MDSVDIEETDSFINHVVTTSNYGTTELERSKLLQTYTRWHGSLYTLVSATESSTASVGLTDLFRCLVPEITDIHIILSSDFITVPECKNLVDSIHFRLDNEDINDNKEFNLPKLKARTGVILLCKIVPGWSENGHICLSDGTDSIPCQIPGTLGKDVLTLIDRWVLITSFNLISQSHKDKMYIEVCQTPIPVYPVNDLQNVTVVSPEDAKHILKYKELLKVDSVNVLIEVVAVSEIFRVKSDLIFCIQLKGNINIIIKKKEYLYWQTLIVPQEEYVFTNLKPTTLKKGIGENVKVFVPWKDSRVLPKCKTNCLVMSLEQLLKYKGLSPSVIHERRHDEVQQEMRGRHESLCNYQGTITSTQHAKLGFYTLDNKIGLFTCCVPVVYRYNSLRVGTKIVVHNAHMMSSSQEPKLRIMCCLPSCIKVVEWSYIESKVTAFDPVPYFQRLFWKHGLNMVELDCVISIYYSLVHKLYPYYTRSVEQILKILLQSLLDRTVLCQRNFLQEFLTETSHNCCISKKKECVYICDKVPEVKDVICIEDMSRNFQLDGTNSGDRDIWMLNIMNASRGHILIGQLQLSPLTGKIQLCDISGQMNCIIAEILDVQSDHLWTSRDHRCTTECQNIYDGCKSVCPWINPSFIGSIVSITNFVVVTEIFSSNENQADGPKYSLNSDNCYKYLTFSMKDVLFLKVPIRDQCNLSGGINMCRKRKWQEDETEKMENQKSSVHEAGTNQGETTPHELIACIEHVESLILEGKRNNPQLRFSAIGFILDKDELQSDAGHEIISTILSDKIIKNVSFSEKNGESFIVQDSLVIGNGCFSKKIDMNANLPSDCTKETTGNIPLKRAIATATTQNMPSKGVTAMATTANIPSKRDIAATVESRPPHTLLFQGNAIQWYSCIVPGSVYRFISLDKVINVNKTRVTSWHLKQAASKAGGKSCIVLPEDISCERILSPFKCSKYEDCGFCNSRVPPVVSVKDILAENFSEVLVSFICQIRSRKHVKPDFMTTGKITQNDKLTTLGISVLKNRAIQLQVQCASSGEIILVYMNLDNSSYPLGLLPGTVVHFHKMERKISKSGKIYCQYITVSSVRILKYSPLGSELLKPHTDRNSETETFTRTDTEKIPLEKAPHWYLSDIWRRGYDMAAMFKCVCHVQKVLRISLKYVCGICGTMVMQNKCSSQHCSNDTEMTFLARASLIVEDGTSVAIVTIIGQDLKKVLMLTDEEWGCLQDRIKCNGEVFLQQMSIHNADYTPLERFVALLCENFNIKRPLEMTMSLQAAMRNKEMKTSKTDIDEMVLEEFAVKTVDTGISTVETRCLPFLQLECCHVQDLNYSEWTLYNLSDIT